MKGRREWGFGRGRRARWVMLATSGALMAAAGAETAMAQSSEDRTRVWLAAGPAGGGASSLETDIGLALQLTGQRGPHQMAVRVLFLGDYDSSGSDDEVGELGLTYGRAVVTWFGYASVSSGIALVSAKGLPDDDGGGGSIYDDPFRRTVGVPFVAEAGLQSPLIGVGVQLFGNLNTLASYAGVGVSLHLGWMP